MRMIAGRLFDHAGRDEAQLPCPLSRHELMHGLLPCLANPVETTRALRDGFPVIAGPVGPSHGFVHLQRVTGRSGTGSTQP
ncbi:hypothetical protein EU803_17645 [Loktanella sp. IMCC34160]|uniref:hypothetical protein n=1 Tax=Loktanella sp. IMCC34160 TaxID=2510646 RepID=UPI00101CAB0A|nr:hypothetical protein [Loktanella sp. IMCC34160]RYG89297.1 hypothetical protein EU803_17645 [Loktanella sp. IMCC34160]